MAKGRIELNRAGIMALLKSEELRAACAEQAQAIANEAGNCSIDEAMLRTRVRVGVRQEMTSKDAEENTLLKAVHFQ